MSSKTAIKKFILSLSEKDYSQANTRLHDIVENKIKEKIKLSVSKKNNNNLDK